MLGILIGMPSTVFPRSLQDSLILSRIFNYRHNFTLNSVEGYTTNVYIKNNFYVRRRNAGLWLIPSMYSIAKGNRYLVSESYNKLYFHDVTNYESKKQACFSTIHRNRSTMTITVEFLTPDIYSVCLYKDHVLSPFNQHNKFFYRYRMAPLNNDETLITFKPRFPENTQLVAGKAHVCTSTGQVLRATIKGEYDNIRFKTEMALGDKGARSLIPNECKTDIEFKFLGNHIYTTFEALYDCPITLPDSVEEVFSMALMDSVRPKPLTIQEKYAYAQYAASQRPDTIMIAEGDSTEKFNFVKDILQDAIGDNLMTSIRLHSEHVNMKLSPILNPQYVGYSSTHGLSYKLKLGVDYYLTPHRYFEFEPWCGYNFKYRKFYFTLPLSFNYNPKRNGHITAVYGNGNRTSNSSITDKIREEHGDSVSLDGQQLDYFDDNFLTVTNNIMAFDWLEINAGFTYHQRISYNPDEMRRYQKDTQYNSFAPMISLKWTPWKKGPVFSIDYERGINGILHSNSDYERWEFDGSMKHNFHPMRKVNIKIGGGFYSRRKDNYFVDYMHFRDNKLPKGWDDDWSGNFQLLNNRWYNESRYYARANVSYESPFLVTSWLPFVGRFVEKERFYCSALSIDNTRPYSELGYGFTTRFLSIGVFSSFLNAEFQELECKFTFELFRRW